MIGAAGADDPTGQRNPEGQLKHVDEFVAPTVDESDPAVQTAPTE